MSVTAFLTDSTLCIGCKACEVACKEWNQISEDGFDWKGFSYDNTGGLGHSTWRHVKFVEGGAVPGIGGNSPEVFPGDFLPTFANIAKCRLPGSVSHGRDCAHRIRRCFHSAGCLQRMRVLRCDLSVWGGRTQSHRGQSLQMHFLL